MSKNLLLLGVLGAAGVYFIKKANASSGPDLSGSPIDLKISDAYYDKAVSALKGQRANELLVLGDQVTNSLGGKQSLFSMLCKSASLSIANRRLGAFKAGEPGGSPALSFAVNTLTTTKHPGVLVTWKAAMTRAKLPGAAATLERAAALLRTKR